MKIILPQKFNQSPLFIDLNKPQVIKLHNYTDSSIFLVSSHILAQLVNSDKEVFILDVFRVDSSSFKEISNFNISYNTKDFENNLRQFNPNNSIIFILSCKKEKLENILKTYKMNNIIFSQEFSLNEDLLSSYDLEIYTIKNMSIILKDSIVKGDKT